METPAQQPAPSPPPSPAVTFLRRYLEMAEKGEITSVVLGYLKADGGAAMQSTPMSAISMNHLSKLLDRRVNREYDRAIAQAAGPRQTTGAGAVPEKARQVANLPRKVRREVEQRNKNLQKMAAKKAARKKAATEVVRNTSAPAPSTPLK